jgi:hypothetical protein
MKYFTFGSGLTNPKDTPSTYMLRLLNREKIAIDYKFIDSLAKYSELLDRPFVGNLETITGNGKCISCNPSPIKFQRGLQGEKDYMMAVVMQLYPTAVF